MDEFLKNKYKAFGKYYELVLLLLKLVFKEFIMKNITIIRAKK